LAWDGLTSVSEQGYAVDCDA